MIKLIVSFRNYIFLFMIIFFLPASVFAQKKIKGEIININYKYKIAFTDIGSDSLSVGDIVEVRMRTEHNLSLQVIETTNVLSTLAPRTPSKKNLSDNLFDTIKVGDIVIKVGKGPSPDIKKYSSQLRHAKEQTKKPTFKETLLEDKNESLVVKEPVLNYDHLDEDCQGLKAQLQESEKQKEQFKQHLEHLNAQIAEKNSHLQIMEREYKIIENNLSLSYLDIEKLKREKQEQDEKIFEFKEIIKQLNDKFIKMSEALQKESMRKNINF